ncbi:hypothetical protein [Fundidesulfovibrio putealis]|uniref:hypothetical protein n=1 Tax=Fundidesulfovibrio putealis TaxID=270496 RepID=UPI0004883C8D|nr:hypothetical protein [Fundidesulfovibrio putealis]
MCPAPLPDTHEVINELMRMAASRPLYPLELMKLKKAADLLLPKEPHIARSAYGVIACLKGDEATMRREHEMSIKLQPWDSNMHRNYGRSLYEHGHVQESIPYMVRAVELAPEDLPSLDSLLKYAYAAGDTVVLDAWLPEFAKRTGVDHVVREYLREDLEDVELLDQVKVEDEPNVAWETLKAELGL